MIAEASTSEDLWEMKGQMLAKRSSLGQRMPLNLSDTAATRHDGSSLEFIAPIAGKQCYI